jgi:colanic acid biosynthesis glycosyl transferase WcaI
VASVPLTGTAARAVEQSGGGVVVAPQQPQLLADAVLDLYQNPQKAEQLGQQGRQYAMENYEFEQALSRYEALFAQVVADSTGNSDVIKALPAFGAEKPVVDA